MEIKNNYYKKRELNCLDKISCLCKELPPIVTEFVIGIESYTSPLTRLNYVYDLRIFFDYLQKEYFSNYNLKTIGLNELSQLETTDFEKYLNYLNYYEFNGKKLTCKESAKARKLASVRTFFKNLYNKNKLKSDIPAKIPLPKIHDKEIIKLEVNEVTELLNIAETGNNLSKRQASYHENTKIRDVAMLTLFLGTGIRISELVGLNVKDFDFNNMSFIVTRKGGNKTILYINDEIANSIIKWLDYRCRIKELEKDEQALFLSLQNRRISVRAVENLVKKYAKIVCPLKKITPHKLRSTFGTNLYSETKDIYIVADFLGHKDINTTKKHYATISEEIRRNAIKNVKLRDD